MKRMKRMSKMTKLKKMKFHLYCVISFRSTQQYRECSKSRERENLLEHSKPGHSTILELYYTIMNILKTLIYQSINQIISRLIKDDNKFKLSSNQICRSSWGLAPMAVWALQEGGNFRSLSYLI